MNILIVNNCAVSGFCGNLHLFVSKISEVYTPEIEKIYIKFNNGFGGKKSSEEQLQNINSIFAEAPTDAKIYEFNDKDIMRLFKKVNVHINENANIKLLQEMTKKFNLVKRQTNKFKLFMIIFCLFQKKHLVYMCVKHV